MDRLFFRALLLVRNESKGIYNCFNTDEVHVWVQDRRERVWAYGCRTDERGCGRMGAGQTRDSYFDYFLFFLL